MSLTRRVEILPAIMLVDVSCLRCLTSTLRKSTEPESEVEDVPTERSHQSVGDVFLMAAALRLDEEGGRV